MRAPALTFTALPILVMPILVMGVLAFGQARADEPEAPKAAYPAAVAMSHTEQQGWVFKQFPNLVYLYTRDQDGPQKSNCGDDQGCYTAWPPLFASDVDHPIGDWTIFDRDDGRKQWAYKKKPVYRRYHDVPDDPDGPLKEGFHLLHP